MATGFDVAHVVYYIEIGGGTLVSIITPLIISYKCSMTSGLACVRILYTITAEIVLSVK